MCFGQIYHVFRPILLCVSIDSPTCSGQFTYVFRPIYIGSDKGKDRQSIRDQWAGVAWRANAIEIPKHTFRPCRAFIDTNRVPMQYVSAHVEVAHASTCQRVLYAQCTWSKCLGHEVINAGPTPMVLQRTQIGCAENLMWREKTISPHKDFHYPIGPTHLPHLASQRPTPDFPVTHTWHPSGPHPTRQLTRLGKSDAHRAVLTLRGTRMWA